MFSRRIYLFTIALALLVWGCAGETATADAQPETAAAEGAMALETEDQKTLYALGVALSQNLGPFSLTDSDLKYVQQGLKDGVLGNEPQVEMPVYGPKIQEMAQSRMTAAAGTEKAAAAEFLTQMAAEEGAKVQESGLIITEIEAGDGPSPSATDQVTVHYHGTLRDGSVFDSSRDRGQPATFPLNQVIPCWTEGVQMMKVGGKAKLVCPSDIAYGDQGRPPQIPGGAALVFEVELISIEGGE